MAGLSVRGSVEVCGLAFDVLCLVLLSTSTYTREADDACSKIDCYRRLAGGVCDRPCSKCACMCVCVWVRCVPACEGESELRMNYAQANLLLGNDIARVISNNSRRLPRDGVLESDRLERRI